MSTGNKQESQKTVKPAFSAGGSLARCQASGPVPTMTIVTPSFNQGKFIERTIESVLSQDYPGLEHIVVDGGSTDETLDILKRYSDRLRWISEPDSGQSDAINKGFRMGKGEILAWLNSDDIYLPGALAAVGRFFSEHPDVMMVYGEGYMIDETDGIKCRFPFTEPKFDLWKLIYYGDYILQQSTFFRRSVFDSVDLLNESLHYGMDWDLFIRIGKRFRVGYMPEYIGCIREHGEAKTSTGGVRRFRELVRLIRQHGIRRYPYAYFNYAWDALGKPATGGSSDGEVSVRYALFGSFVKILQRALPLYLRRLQQGYYADGWVGKRALIVKPNYCPAEANKLLSISGEVPGTNVPLQVSISVNRECVMNHKVMEPGRFDLTLPLTDGVCHADSYHVMIECSKTFVPSKLGISSDPRDLGFLLKSIDVISGEEDRQD